MITTFQKITDLTPSIVLNGTEQIEMVHNPGGTEEESQSVTPNQLRDFVSQISSGLTDPTDPPPNPAKIAFFWNENTGYGWRWVVKDQEWT